VVLITSRINAAFLSEGCHSADCRLSFPPQLWLSSQCQDPRTQLLPCPWWGGRAPEPRPPLPPVPELWGLGEAVQGGDACCCLPLPAPHLAPGGWRGLNLPCLISAKKDRIAPRRLQRHLCPPRPSPLPAAPFICQHKLSRS